MYDIEVIEGHSYAVIGEDTQTYEFIKAMNTKLVMKKLSSEPGEEIYLTISEMASINGRYKLHDYKRLAHIGLIEITDRFGENFKFSFTEYGLSITKEIREYGGDIEIRI